MALALLATAMFLVGGVAVFILGYTATVGAEYTDDGLSMAELQQEKRQTLVAVGGTLMMVGLYVGLLLAQLENNQINQQLRQMQERTHHAHRPIGRITDVQWLQATSGHGHAPTQALVWVTVHNEGLEPLEVDSIELTPSWYREGPDSDGRYDPGRVEPGQPVVVGIMQWARIDGPGRQIHPERSATYQANADALVVAPEGDWSPWGMAARAEYDDTWTARMVGMVARKVL